MLAETFIQPDETLYRCAARGVVRWILSVYVSNLFKTKLNVEPGWNIDWVMESQIYQHLLLYLFLFYRIVSIDSDSLSTSREAHEAFECITAEQGWGFSFMVSDQQGKCTLLVQTAMCEFHLPAMFESLRELEWWVTGHFSPARETTDA